MLDWQPTAAEGEPIAWQMILTQLAASAVLGLVVVGIYKLTQRRTNGGQVPLLTTLVLLSILVAMTTIVIGENLARAFGLVGALSIVRFRTVVEDTRDTAFVIFAVVVGMAIGAGHWLVCLIGMPIVAAAAIGLSRVGEAKAAAGPEKRLEVRFGAGLQPETLLAGIFPEHLDSWRQTAVVSARQGAAFDLIYLVRLKRPEGLLALVKAIHAVDGVQNVELRDV